MVYRWSPPRELVDSSNVKAFMDSAGFSSYGEFVRRSVEDYRWFWRLVPGVLGVSWFRDFTDVVDLSRGVEWASWYIGGLLNASYNVVDLQVERGLGGSTAFIWVGEDSSVVEYTYSDLLDRVSRFASFLRDSGVGRGDVVSIYAPMMPESVVAMLASIRIGAVASPIFSGFGPSAVSERLRLAGSRVLVTVDGFYRRGRVVRLKDLADRAIDLGSSVERVVVIRRFRDLEVSWSDSRDIYFDDALKSSSRSDPVPMDPNDPALLLFTSGTTGRPKGAVISHIGSIIQPGKEHYFNLDIHRGDRLWWISDLGWMMGPWQVMGSQLLGASHIMVEGAIDYPSRDRVWMIIDRFKVTHFGFAATVARMLRSITGRDVLEKYDLSSLRVFGNTGEPIDPATWMWVMRDVGGERRPIINLSGGTEIFGCILMPSVVTDLKPSTLWGPALGIDADVFNDRGESVRGEVGYLVVRKPAPSMTRGLWRDPERYIETYWSRFPGVWYHGDWAYVDNEGFWFLYGRADDVIKVAGKRIGPAEVEGSVNRHPSVAESACIGFPDPVKGEVIACFVKLKAGSGDFSRIAVEIRDQVARDLGKPFSPEKIVFVEDLPRTRSGKIMRRVIKALATGSSIGDVSTLENPELIDRIAGILRDIDRYSY